MTPTQSRAARAMLNLDIKSVCKAAAIGKRTLSEFELGRRSPNASTLAKIEAFYISSGIAFEDTGAGELVYLRRIETYDAEYPSEIKDKLERAELFDLTTLYEAIGEVVDTLSRSDRDISSRLIARSLKASGVTQKELARTLGCSPAFLSAVIGRKKLLPVKMAELIADINRVDSKLIEKLLEIEILAAAYLKRLRAGGSDIRSLIEALRY